MLRKKSGFTLIELLIVVLLLACFVLVVLVGIVGTVLQGNMYFKEASVVRELNYSLEVTDVTIAQVDRNVFKPSVVTITYNDGEADATYCIESNVMSDITLTPCRRE